MQSLGGRGQNLNSRCSVSKRKEEKCILKAISNFCHTVFVFFEVF